MERKRTGILAMVLALVWLMVPGNAPAQRVFQFTSRNVALEILPAEIFKARYGNNPLVPKTEEEIIALAQRLFVPAALEMLETEMPVEECGTMDLLRLDAALQNPEISDQTRRLVDFFIFDPIPELPKTKLIGHFRFHWTENDPNDSRHNVTLEQIEETALILNNYWEKCVNTLQIVPYHKRRNGVDLIDVNVYFSPSYSGYADHLEKTIHLNSRWVVKDACRRRANPAHELFHTVQFTCGVHENITDAGWLIEGSAVWAQKWLQQGADLRMMYDYILRMNQGLKDPEKDLLVERDYDAAHFWIYLAERGGWEVIQKVMQIIKNQGTKNYRRAVNLALKEKMGLNFDQFAHKWHKANYIKGMRNATPEYDYTEDGRTFTNCNKDYTLGPVTPILDYKIHTNRARFTVQDWIKPYGARYYKIKLGPEVTKVRLKATGEATGEFGFYFLGIKDNWGLESKQTFKNAYTYSKTITPGEWSHVLVMVMGRSQGGAYTLEANPPGPCLTGHWQTLTKSMDLVQNGSIITGVTVYGETISGTYNPPNVTWTETVDNPPANSCYPLTITATVNSDCDELNGTLQQADKPNCGQTRTFKAWKEY